jgi:poly(A) polymerase/tRNA nucleotidyltransferase (CCA-adding enzyme)
LKRGESKAVENLKVRIDRIIEQENAITVKDLALNGHDVMREFNLKPGPIIGKILNHLLEEILDDPSKNTREILFRLASVFLQKEKSYL